MMIGEPEVYFSVDKAVCDTEEEAANYPMEFLNNITWQNVYWENWYMNIQLNLGLQNPHLALVGKLLCVDFLFSTFSDSAWPV